MVIIFCDRFQMYTNNYRSNSLEKPLMPNHHLLLNAQDSLSPYSTPLPLYMV